MQPAIQGEPGRGVRALLEQAGKEHTGSSLSDFHGSDKLEHDRLGVRIEQGPHRATGGGEIRQCHDQAFSGRKARLHFKGGFDDDRQGAHGARVEAAHLIPAHVLNDPAARFDQLSLGGDHVDAEEPVGDATKHLPQRSRLACGDDAPDGGPARQRRV